MKRCLFIVYIILANKCLFISGCTAPPFQNLNVPGNFNVTKFLGRWFEVQWLPATPHNASDIWRNFYQDFQWENSSNQTLLASGQARLLNSETCFSVGTWRVIANNSARMILETKDITSNDSLHWPYYVLQTDYDHYALIYGCISKNFTQIVPCAEPILWLLSRSTSLSTIYSTTLMNYIENNLCVNLTHLELTPHDGKQCYSSSSSSHSRLMNFVLFVCLFFLYI